MATANNMAAKEKSFTLVISILRKVPLRVDHFGRSRFHLARNDPKSCGKSATRRQFLASRGCLTKSQHSPARVLRLGPLTDRPSRVLTTLPGSRSIHAHHA